METAANQEGLLRDGEIMLAQYTVQHVADLSYAQGLVGDKRPLPDEAAKKEFANEMAGQLSRITKLNTAYCGDERSIIRMHDGSAIDLMAHRLFGGIGLAMTKALVA